MPCCFSNELMMCNAATSLQNPNQCRFRHIAEQSTNIIISFIRLYGSTQQGARVVQRSAPSIFFNCGGYSRRCRVTAIGCTQLLGRYERDANALELRFKISVESDDIIVFDALRRTCTFIHSYSNKEQGRLSESHNNIIFNYKLPFPLKISSIFWFCACTSSVNGDEFRAQGCGKLPWFLQIASTVTCEGGTALLSTLVPTLKRDSRSIVEQHQHAHLVCRHIQIFAPLREIRLPKWQQPNKLIRLLW